MQTASSNQNQPRKAALDTLAVAPSRALADLWDRWADKPDYAKVRGPEVGLVMVRGRAGGGGAPFNLGEASVSRASAAKANGREAGPCRSNLPYARTPVPSWTSVTADLPSLAASEVTPLKSDWRCGGDSGDVRGGGRSA